MPVATLAVLLCLLDGNSVIADLLLYQATPGARKSAPVDRQHVLHIHICLISRVKACCKRYDPPHALCILCMER